MSTTMLAQAVSPHVVPTIVIIIVKPLMRCLKKGGLSTQLELDALFEGGEFDIEGRVAYVCTSILVTFMYSSGIPVLLWFNFAGLVLTFAVDKLLILRFYSQPPNYTAKIPQTIASILPFGTIIHMAIALCELKSGGPTPWGTTRTAAPPLTYRPSIQPWTRIL